MRFVSFEVDSQELDISHLHTNGGRDSQLHSQGSVQSNLNAGMYSQSQSTNWSDGADGIAHPSRTSSAKGRLREQRTGSGSRMGAELAEDGHLALQNREQAQQQPSRTTPDVRPVPSAANIMRDSPRQLVALDLQEDAITFVEMTQSDSPRFTSSEAEAPSEQVAHMLSPSMTQSASVLHYHVQGFGVVCEGLGLGL